MKKSNIKTLGNCQCCGRLQAVLGTGKSSKHGYTVDHGWFSGVCSGQNFEPLQVSRTQTDLIIESVISEVASLEERLADLQLGKAFPSKISLGAVRETKVDSWGHKTRHWVTPTIPFVEGTAHQQADAVRSEIRKTEARIRFGTAFAADLTNLADAVHGQPLQTETKVALQAIRDGERRVRYGKVLTAVDYYGGARVPVTSINSKGLVFRSWIGVATWRKLPLEE